MVDLAMLQVVRDLVAIFGVIAGFVYYVLTVGNAQKTRRTQLFTQIYSDFRGLKTSVYTGRRREMLKTLNT